MAPKTGRDPSTRLGMTEAAIVVTEIYGNRH